MSSEFMTARQCERFLRHVDVQSDEDCWNYKAGKGQRYGAFGIGNRKYRAHRIAYQWQYEETPEGQNVCHHCDNTFCCNPLHLFLGTQKRNMEDCSQKGRIVSPRGTAHYRTRLTEDQVLEIRRLRKAGETLQQIADRFGIANQTVSTIALRQFWAWLPDPS